MGAISRAFRDPLQLRALLPANGIVVALWQPYSYIDLMRGEVEPARVR